MRKGTKWRMMFLPAVLGVFLLIAFNVPGANAVVTLPVVLTSGNSSATIDPTVPSGMSEWTVDGTSQLFTEWFWYRAVDLSDPNNLVNSIDTLGTPVITPTANTLNVLYNTNPFFTLNLNYTLTGGALGSSLSDMLEAITITNITDVPLDLAFYMHTDFDLAGTPTDDSASFIDPNAVFQTDPTGIGATVTSSVEPTFWEINEFANLGSAFGAGTVVDLANATSPLGPTDIEWAFQWNMTLAGLSGTQITIDKAIGPVPEPGTLLLLGFGLVMAFAAQRKYKGRKTLKG